MDNRDLSVFRFYFVFLIRITPIPQVQKKNILRDMLYCLCLLVAVAVGCGLWAVTL
jgi:hypothetical protein